MAQLEVQNTTEEEIAVMWNGQQVYFKPNKKKVFEEGVAKGIILEGKGLELVDDNKPEVVEEVAETITESSADKYTEAETKRGIQYRKNGKIISKAEYEAR